MLFSILTCSLTADINSYSGRARPGRSAPVLCLDCQLVLTGYHPVQLTPPRYPDNMDVSHGVKTELTLLVPLSYGEDGPASVLQVQVSDGDE